MLSEIEQKKRVRKFTICLYHCDGAVGLLYMRNYLKGIYYSWLRETNDDETNNTACSHAAMTLLKTI